MLPRLREFFVHHPLVREALVWAIPALIVGVVLRGLMLQYLPYAYWGSDSRSYFGFTEQFLDTWKISLYDKRRYLYPISLLPVTLLPGSPLKWVAWLQHGLGLATLVPLAYCVRRVFVGWRLWIIPITVLYAGLPLLLWYEHELLAEALFFHAFVWMMAGWFAYACQKTAGQAANRFWWFFAGLAAVILTKPAGRFLWPAVLLGLAVTFAWRTLNRKHWIALGALFGLTFTIGQDTQGAWLLYTSAFPLTCLDTPKHAEFKAEVADLVRTSREQLEMKDTGPDSKAWVHFLKWPEKQDARPQWKSLGDDDGKKQRVYKELAIEGIKAHPFLFLKIALGKIIASANPGEFKANRFLPSYYVEKYERQYVNDTQQKPERVRRLFGLGKDFSFPPYSEFQKRIAPEPDSVTAQWLRGFVDRYHSTAHLVKSDDEDDPEVTLTPLAWWVLLGSALAFAPGYWRTIGFGVLVSGSYLFGTFLVGGVNPRYFGAVWAVVAMALAVPLDLLFGLVSVKLGSKS